MGEHLSVGLRRNRGVAGENEQEPGFPLHASGKREGCKNHYDETKYLLKTYVLVPKDTFYFLRLFGLATARGGAADKPAPAERAPCKALFAGRTCSEAPGAASADPP